MPNQRAAGIVNVSFTMPAEMARVLEQRAKRDLTNKSEIVRRAIMAYLPASERAEVMGAVMNDAPNPDAMPHKGKVKYPTKQKKP